MKKILLSIAICLFTGVAAWAQAPGAFNYQGVARDLTGAPITGTAIGLRLSIHDGSSLGSIVYQETHTVTTNAFGLYNTAIGTGTVTIGTFNTVAWSTGNKFLEVEIDPAGGSSYTSLGASQLLSVPYALYAAGAPGDNWGTAVAVTDATLAGTGVTGTPLKIAQQGATTGQVLQWNGTTWIPATSSNWTLTGNAGTNSGTNFIGTTDTATLRFKVNNQSAGEINMRTSNVALGYNAGMSNTTGFGNVAIGNIALKANTTGVSNTAVGDSALSLNTTGFNNTGVGWGTLYANTSGANNTATGNASLSANTTGGFNSAFGDFALTSNTTGNQNTAAGENALALNTTGSYNTAIGDSAMAFNTIGQSNTAVGIDAMRGNTTGNWNAALGEGALQFATIDTGNTAIGTEALNKTTTGGFNTATGISAMFNNTTGKQNSAYGLNSVQNNTTGNYNSGFGGFALQTNSTGTFNTAAGYDADVSSGGFTNASAFGAFASTNASNKIVVGSSSVTVIGGFTTWTNLSDGRFKSNIVENVPGLDFINRLRPVTYHFDARKFERFLGKADTTIEKLGASYDLAEAQVRTGFIAQDVEQAAQQIGYNFSGLHTPTNEKDNYSLGYAEFTVPLVKAVQELSAKNAALQAKVDDLTRRLEALENR